MDPAAADQSGAWLAVSRRYGLVLTGLPWDDTVYTAANPLYVQFAVPAFCTAIAWGVQAVGNGVVVVDSSGEVGAGVGTVQPVLGEPLTAYTPADLTRNIGTIDWKWTPTAQHEAPGGGTYIRPLQFASAAGVLDITLTIYTTATVTGLMVCGLAFLPLPRLAADPLY